jgi:Putative beta-barrel porin-2, OmpL-like. bbp2
MNFQKKFLVVALAAALPCISAQAQSAADLKKEIEALKAQLQVLQQKVEAATAASSAISSEQVSRIELKQDQAEADSEKAGLKGLNFKGVLSATYSSNDLQRNHVFESSDGNTGNAMLELTKETDGGEGISWTLRLTPNDSGTAQIHEASISVPVSDGNRLIGGLIPDYQGYEAAFAHQNLLVTHNALFDLAGPTAYKGIGMSNQLTKDLALKWVVGNIDRGTDEAYASSTYGSVANTDASVGLAYRFDWTLSEYAAVGLSGAHANVNRNFNVMAVDGSFIRGDWTFNGHINAGNMKGAAYNLDAAGNPTDASWWGLSALAGYKLTPRLQLLARADYLYNRANGGGTYVGNYFRNSTDSFGLDPLAGTGLGAEKGADGLVVTDGSGNAVGANLTRISVGTNYLINPSTQWKLEYRVDQSTGQNFVDHDGSATSRKATLSTALVVFF